MTAKTLMTAAILSLAPGLALAMCNWDKSSTTASQCGQGQVWDATTQACITAATS